MKRLITGALTAALAASMTPPPAVAAPASGDAADTPAASAEHGPTAVPVP